ncbi:hypothetical protein B7463_g1246, partial [Scytalidium lignicola]
MSYQKMCVESDNLEISEDRFPLNPLQSHVQSTDIPTLVLISHSHSPPLLPPPQLKFDLRSLPNPPKHIRDAYTGVSSRLQEWLKNDPRFISKRDSIRHEIEGIMARDMDMHTQLKSGDDDLTDKNNATSKTPNTKPSELSPPTEPEVRVGIFCAMGKHRSVAMVEELAAMTWPGWQLKVIHRDLMKRRGISRKTMRDNKRSEFVNHDDEYQ